MNVVPDPDLIVPEADGQDAARLAPGKKWSLDALREAVDGLISRKPKVRPHEAVAEFLRDMDRLAKGVFPGWESLLKAHIEATELEFLAKRGLFERHDLYLYFYCGVVAIEAIKVRSLFDYTTAAELESEINEQIDAVLGHRGHKAADLVFDMLRTVKRAEVDQLIKPHDQVMKWIVRLLELDKIPETKELLTDVMFCQEMAAPFAMIHVHWWLSYKDLHRIVVPKAA